MQFGGGPGVWGGSQGLAGVLTGVEWRLLALHRLPEPRLAPGLPQRWGPFGGGGGRGCLPLRAAHACGRGSAAAEGPACGDSPQAAGASVSAERPEPPGAAGGSGPPSWAGAG